MNARIVEHLQGTEAWHEHRAKSLNASDLAAAMGLSPYKTRAALIRERATGVVPEVDAMTAQRFAQGHKFEAIAREWAEDMLQDTLYPTVLAAEVDGLPLSASLDGQTLDGSVIFEHKTGRADLLASLEAGVIPEQYHPQMEQGLLVSGAKRCLFMASSGDRDAMRFTYYESRPELRAQIVPVWRQFLADVAAYAPSAPAEVIIFEPVESLPAVAVRVDGSLVVQSNLPAFGAALKAFVAKVPKNPSTDSEFAQTEAACKALKQAEDRLQQAEDSALASMSDVEAMRRMVADFRGIARTARLASEKMVKSRKDQIREDECTRGRNAAQAHIAALNARLGQQFMPIIASDFAGAIRGLKSIDSLRNAIDTEIARFKIAANEVADRIDANLKTLAAAGAPTLFPDRAQLVLKAPDDLAAVIAQRLDAEQKRQDAERERIRAEEAAKAQREAEARARAEQDKRDADARRAAEEAQRVADAAKAPAPVVAEPVAPAPIDPGPVTAVEPPVVGGGGWLGPARVAEKPSVSLTAMCDRLGLSLTAADLVRFGIPVRGHEKQAKLYYPSDVGRICDALIAHLQKVQR